MSSDNGALIKTLTTTIVSALIITILTTFLYIGWKTASEAQAMSMSAKHEIVATDGKINVLTQKIDGFMDGYSNYMEEQREINTGITKKLETITRSLTRLEIQQEAHLKSEHNYRRSSYREEPAFRNRPS
jgi:hypothetical protein